MIALVPFLYDFRASVKLDLSRNLRRMKPNIGIIIYIANFMLCAVMRGASILLQREDQLSNFNNKHFPWE